MPVEIRELVIKTTIDEAVNETKKTELVDKDKKSKPGDPAKGPKPSVSKGSDPASMKEAIIEECLSRMADQLNSLKDR